jgi:hypothetical protein
MRISLLLLICFYCAFAQAQDTPASEQCSISSKKIKALISQENHCTNDNECTVTGFGCPFGCFNLINKKFLKEAEALFAQDQTNDCRQFRCMYKCAPPPKETELICKEGQCTTLCKGGRNKSENYNYSWCKNPQ